MMLDMLTSNECVRSYVLNESICPRKIEMLQLATIDYIQMTI